MAFATLNANGIWKLYHRDDSTTGDAGGSVSSWSITVTAQAATATVGDFVFNDSNGNDVQNSGVPGIGGVTVRLLNSPSSTTAATTTTAGGGSMTSWSLEITTSTTAPVLNNGTSSTFTVGSLALS